MSEMLSEMNLSAIDKLYQYRSEGWALDIARLKDDRWDEGYRKACENISMIAKSFAEECKS